MGLLTVGHPLDWLESKKVVEYVKEHGIAQFINIYHNLKNRQGDCLKWGDEIEYNIIKFDHANKKVRVGLKGEHLLDKLMALEKPPPAVNEYSWKPEYASYMIEGTPGAPYGHQLQCFNVVEDNMMLRRRVAQKYLDNDEVLLTIGSFPMLGCPDFTYPYFKPTPTEGASHSLFFPDDAIYKAHPRFKNLTKNIRERRGEKVAINVPVYRDVKTPMYTESDEQLLALGDHNAEGKHARKPHHIYMDAMGFGMGCCCLQVTFQTVNIDEARWLYDQLTPITPVLLALSASTPIFRGYLADVDSRWNIISASVDDRTAEERGLKPLHDDKFVIEKSRYDTTDCYLYSCSAPYNDVELQYEERHYRALIDGGVDELMARHIAHMFIRDPLQIYRERIVQNDAVDTEHFETIQSSNWLNMRFKPPPANDPSIGWRVEFRPTEVQLTDFENAAYVCFVVLLTRVIISFKLTFLIPISKVDENMKRAQKRDAIHTQKFYFRRTLTTCDSPPDAHRACGCDSSPNNGQQQQSSSSSSASNGGASASPPPPHVASEDIVEMTVDEIVNGKPPHFPGLANLIQLFLDSAEVDVDTRCTIQQYVRFVQERSSGRIWTLARWSREFVLNHPAYQKDSKVTDEIAYDLIKTMDDIAQRRAHCPCLLGKFRAKSHVGDVPPSVAHADLQYRTYATAWSSMTARPPSTTNDVDGSSLKPAAV